MIRVKDPAGVIVAECPTLTDARNLANYYRAQYGGIWTVVDEDDNVLRES